jgi:signal transduction histidine kinase
MQPRLSFLELFVFNYCMLWYAGLIGACLGVIEKCFAKIGDNAIKFSPEQGRIRIRLIEKENELELRVADQGSGISDEEKKVIFGKFVRGKKQRGGAGFGLGLNFVLQVVEAHHGRVEVRDGDLGGAELVMNLGKG